MDRQAHRACGKPVKRPLFAVYHQLAKYVHIQVTLLISVIVNFLAGLDRLIDELQLESSELQSTRKYQFDAAIFLPPQYHLLMKFQLSRDNTVISLASDYWRIFVFIDKCLEEAFV